jgi:hypothetical protein
MDEDVRGQVGTRIISQRELDVDGVAFEWWAVGEHPALVTVRAPGLGSLTEPNSGDVAEFAAALARKLIAQQRALANPARKSAPAPARISVLEKPGWFEPGSTDFSTTIF